MESLAYILDREAALGVRPSDDDLPDGRAWCNNPDCPEWGSGPAYWNHDHQRLVPALVGDC